MGNQFISLETYAGEQIGVGDKKILPFNQALTIRFPSSQGGLIWNRPVSVLETSSNGDERVIRILDVTRIAQIMLLSIGAFGSLLIWLLFRTSQKTKE